METVQDKSYNKIEWIFYIVILPLLFTSILTGILLHFLGVNVVGSLQVWLNQVPYVASIVPDPDTRPDANLTPQQEVTYLNEQMKRINAELTEKKGEVATLSKIADEREAKIKELQQEIEQLEKALEDKRISDEEQLKQIRDLAELYSSMSASKAAPIIEALTLEEAVLVMKAMDPEEQGDIFAKMDPEKAAEISILLKDTKLHQDDQIAALQQRVQVLTRALSESAVLLQDKEKLINTYSQMPPKEAADILINMMNTDQTKALAIVSGVDDGVRSQILTEIARRDVNLASRITNLLMQE
ncbi:MAG: MotE family protein [Bacillaceae bacterium]|nr:MotE family protein [Bacillaceae bacterium]